MPHSQNDLEEELWRLRSVEVDLERERQHSKLLQHQVEVLQSLSTEDVLNLERLNKRLVDEREKLTDRNIELNNQITKINNQITKICDLLVAMDRHDLLEKAGIWTPELKVAQTEQGFVTELKGAGVEVRTCEPLLGGDYLITPKVFDPLEEWAKVQRMDEK